MNPTNLHRWLLSATMFLGPFLTQSAFGRQAGPPPPPIPGLTNQQASPVVQALPAPAPPRSLSGHVPPAVAELGLTPIGDLGATQRLDLAIGLPVRNQQALDQLLQQLYDPASPNYRNYLTPAEFTAKFGPTEEDYAVVIAFAQTRGLAVTATYPNRMLVDVNGSVADIEGAFNVTMRVYQHPTEARTFYAPNVEPSVDGAVPVLAIGGLNNYFLARRTPRVISRTTPAEGIPALGSGTNGSYLAGDLRSAYLPDVPATLAGAGQTVGLAEYGCGFYTNDILAYEATNGLPNVPVRPVLVDGYGGDPGEPYLASEIASDIEMVMAMAPGTSGVFVYEGPGGSYDDVLNTMAYPPPGVPISRQLSSSWSWNPDTNACNTLLEFAAQGQSFFSASGDGDANAPHFWSILDDPYLTLVGGTELRTTGPGGAYVSERVWDADTNACIGSEGGISTTWTIPTWQLGVDMSSNQGSTNMRNSPDVAMVADGVFITYNDGQSAVAAGTSLASPLWAGLTALVNDQAAANGYPLLGFLNPALYAIGKGQNYNLCFHDVTQGSNQCTKSQGLFYAATGYDLCTGWGSPAGMHLINELIKVTAGAVSCGRLTNSTFSFNVNLGAAPPANALEVYGSGDLSSWGLMWSNQAGAGIQAFSDPAATNDFYFYRAVCGTNCWRATGFVRRQVSAGCLDLVANPLDAPVNTLDGLFTPMPDGTFLPGGAQIYKQNTQGSWTFDEYQWSSNCWSMWNAASNVWTPAGASVTLSPGEGFWIANPSSNLMTLTFAGLVRQGALVNPISTNTWIYSSMVPQTGLLQTDLQYIPNTGDEVFIYDPTNINYSIYTYGPVKHPGCWWPYELVLQAGQAFVLSPAATNSWNRRFSSCQ